MTGVVCFKSIFKVRCRRNAGKASAEAWQTKCELVGSSPVKTFGRECSADVPAGSQTSGNGSPRCSNSGDCSRGTCTDTTARHTNTSICCHPGVRGASLFTSSNETAVTLLRRRTHVSGGAPKEQWNPCQLSTCSRRHPGQFSSAANFWPTSSRKLLPAHSSPLIPPGAAVSDLTSVHQYVHCLLSSYHPSQPWRPTCSRASTAICRLY